MVEGRTRDCAEVDRVLVPASGSDGRGSTRARVGGVNPEAGSWARTTTRPVGVSGGRVIRAKTGAWGLVGSVSRGMGSPRAEQKAMALEEVLGKGKGIGWPG